MLGCCYLAHNAVERGRIGAVQRVDSHLSFVAPVTEAKIAEDAHRNDRAAHTSPDHVADPALPDVSRLRFYLFQLCWMGEQTCYSLDPIEFERTPFTAECSHQAIAPSQLTDGIVLDQVLEGDLSGVVILHE